MPYTRRYLLNCLGGATAVAALLRADASVGATLPEAQAGEASLEARIRSDFAAGRIVRVDHWVLSETEARLCRSCA